MSQPNANASIATRRNALLLMNPSRALYLGRPDCSEYVQWVSHGVASRLVIKQAPGSSLSAEIPPVSLVILARISRDKFFLLPDAAWKPRQNSPPLKKAKASGLAIDPNLSELQGDFKTAWDNLRHFIEMKTPGIQPGDFGVINSSAGALNQGLYIKIGQRLFMPKNHGPPDSGLDAMKIENWPTTTDEASEEIHTLFDTHVPVPIQAFDAQGDLIMPLEYRDKLQGAVVRLHFHLHHWFIEGHHRFSADIEQIRVLQEPEPIELIATPTKPLRLRDDFDDEESPQPPPKRSRHGGNRVSGGNHEFAG